MIMYLFVLLSKSYMSTHFTNTIIQAYPFELLLLNCNYLIILCSIIFSRNKKFLHSLKMIFKPSMFVVLTKGKFAGRKAVIIKNIDDNTLLIAGINRIPKESPDYLANWEKRKNSKFLSFVKKINIKHVLATRYRADMGLGDLELDGDFTDVNCKASINNQVNSMLKLAFETKKSKWLFTPLNF